MVWLLEHDSSLATSKWQYSPSHFLLSPLLSAGSICLYISWGSDQEMDLTLSLQCLATIKKFRASFTLKSVKFKARKRYRAQYIVGTNAIILSDIEYGETWGKGGKEGGVEEKGRGRGKREERRGEGRGRQRRRRNWGGMPNEVRVKPGK